MGVNLWGESPLYENQGHPCPYERMLTKVRANGKGDSARNGPKEAGWHHPRSGYPGEPTDRNRITHKWVPEAQLRVSGHDITKPDGSGGRVNAAVVHGQFTFLSGKICLTCVR